MIARSILDQDGFLFVSDKQIIRYLKKFNWNLQKALQTIILCGDMRLSLLGGPDSQTLHAHSDDFHMLSQRNCLIYNGSRDRKGRPILYIVTRNICLKDVSIEQMSRYVCHVMDAVCADMPPHMDNLLLIVDCEQFGQKNWSKAHFKSLIQLFSVVYPERIYATCIVRQKVAVKAIQKIANKLVDESSRRKWHFMGADYQSELQALVARD